MTPDLDNILHDEMHKLAGRASYADPNYLIYLTPGWRSPFDPEVKNSPSESDCFCVSDMKMDYYEDPNTTPRPANGTSTEVINNSSVEQTLTVVINHETSTSAEWTFTEGFKIGVKVTGGVEVPLIAEGKLEVSAEINFAATQKHSETGKQAWTVNQPVKVPPHSRMVATLMVDEVTFTQKFHTRCTLRGKVRLEYPISKIFGQPVDIDSVEEDVATLFRGHPVKGFTVDGNVVHFEGDGECSGIVGLRSTIQYTEYKIDDPKNAVRTFSVPLAAAAISQMA